MNKLSIFLVTDTAGQKGFERIKHYIETKNTFMLVVNQWDWRETWANDLYKSPECDAIMIVGDWINDEAARMVVDWGIGLKKPFCREGLAEERQLNIYAKTAKLRRLIGESVDCGMLRGNVITFDDMRGKCRKAEYVIARMIFCKFCRDVFGMQYTEIGWLLDRCHNGVSYLIQRYDDWVVAKQHDDMERVFNEANDNILKCIGDDSEYKIELKMGKPTITPKQMEQPTTPTNSIVEPDVVLDADDVALLGDDDVVTWWYDDDGVHSSDEGWQQAWQDFLMMEVDECGELKQDIRREMTK
jgi:hypothetical protein